MKIALAGNPNAGKSTLFNQLTGLHQKVGNFPGVTVDKKTGVCKLNAQLNIELVDLPGTYSLYPKSLDETIVLETLLNPRNSDYPDWVIVVADASNLKRNLLLFTQIKDLGLPIILVLNQIDQAEEKGIFIDTIKLSDLLGVPVIVLNARRHEQVEKFKQFLLQTLTSKNINSSQEYVVNPYFFEPQLIDKIKQECTLNNSYQAWQYLHHSSHLKFLSDTQKNTLNTLSQQHKFNSVHWQSRETLARYEIIDDLLKETLSQTPQQAEKISFNEKVDAILTHRIGGYVIFLVVLFLIFQAIFSWASYPMDWIDAGFSTLQSWVKSSLPSGALTDLLADGIIAGIGGVVIFIPQIAILFFFIAMLEESGYMARVVYMMDKVMRPFGLNGRSVVPLISGVACAIPAILATRTIDNYKERIITIFVTPLMSCSARLPVYAILIALVIPNKTVLGIFTLQGLVLMAMYLLGFVMALFSAWLMKLILKTPERSFLIMELPSYKYPKWSNVGYEVSEKVKVFIFEAGKIIIAVSIILWVLASYGPSEAMQSAEIKAKQSIQQDSTQNYENVLASYKLEASYAGHFGKVIEPVIAPLGYDWKIGIALITSFAAREVFVGTISTIYSIGSEEENITSLKERLRNEKDPITGKPRFTLAVGISLMIYYAFAMQCMSTLAAVYRETKGWRWVFFQFLYMTGLAYLASLLAFQLLS
jgi:ferrous iron transport protein B